MREPDSPVPSAARWAQEWQQLGRTAMDRGTGNYLRGCASVAMAHTLPEAWVALHEAQRMLVAHSAAAFAEAIELWRKQNSERIRS